MKETKMVKNLNDTEIYYDAAVELMDDDLREKLAATYAYDTEQAFFTAYEQAHAAKYGEEWELSKANPCY